MKLEDIPEKLRGGDWAYAFQCCGVEPVAKSYEDDAHLAYRQYNEPDVRKCIGYEGDAPEFTRADVVEIIACAEGENDGPSWIGVFKIKNGLYAFLEAGCDYTGWDCQSGGSATISDDLEHLIRFGVDEDSRKRLGLNGRAA